MKKLHCELIAIEKITDHHDGHDYHCYRPRFKINGTAVINSEETYTLKGLMTCFGIKEVTDFYALIIQPTLF